MSLLKLGVGKLILRNPDRRRAGPVGANAGILERCRARIGCSIPPWYTIRGWCKRYAVRSSRNVFGGVAIPSFFSVARHPILRFLAGIEQYPRENFEEVR